MSPEVLDSVFWAMLHVLSVMSFLQSRVSLNPLSDQVCCYAADWCPRKQCYVKWGVTSQALRQSAVAARCGTFMSHHAVHAWYGTA